MQIFRTGKTAVNKKLFILLFMAGLIGGVLFANLFGKNYLNQTGILSDYFLSKYKYMEIDYGNLFFYILGKRSMGILFLWIMGVTVLGCPAVWLYLVWYGFSAGMILSMSVMKFGVKGLMLCVGGILPQYVVYVPLLIFFLVKVHGMSAQLYYGKYLSGSSYQPKKQLIVPYVLVLVMTMGGILAGTFLETYVNTGFLKLILKNF
ncbi:stage II sporulation protein M [Diplocloster agilis]|uniref:Stage II sporulation protein M n=2 Tax=Diplocloster agilis TaxID=2850323 RepID=A0A949K156_9FIRM|nr:stage II sporulation protein M [Suonthocola fibrivorans]MBU9739010.1 stage II sporulation protein M [Diplocloster agilis]MCU6735445.1 stage II sporulation protein M [Suonthocola fibrivorans]SCJ73945.1 stage II sporulation protein M [uncultured Clostridium sp.]